MSCAKQPWLVSRYLNDQINSSKVRLQDTAFGISYISEKSYGNMIAWTFIKENWDYLVDKLVVIINCFINNLTKLHLLRILMERIIPNIASKFNTQSQLDDVNFNKYFYSFIPFLK